jgi:P2 phage tail completion protein R (GpR)
MRKPDSLREWLMRSVSGLAAQPDRLHMFIDEGKVIARRGNSLSFAYEYSLTIVIEDFAQPREAIDVPLLAWIADNQSELLDRDAAYSFDADILDNKSADIEIKLTLMERAVVAATEGGGWEVTFPDEPRLDPPFEGAEHSRLWRLLMRSDLVAVHPDHRLPSDTI